jgi:hypothetical protein
MHHLQHAVIERHRPGHVAARPDREELLQILAPRIEIGDDEVAGAVARIDQIGGARAAGRGRAVSVDLDEGVTTLSGTTSRSFGRARRSIDPVGR